MDGVEFPPKLVGLSAQEGSITGSSIEARVPGLGVEDALRFTLVNAATGEDMCTSTSIEEYGKLKCDMKPADLEAGIELAVKNTETG